MGIFSFNSQRVITATGKKILGEQGNGSGSWNAAYEAGEAIRSGEYTLPNLETIVRWKSERMVHYLIATAASIRTALAVAASPHASPRMR